MYLNKNQVSIPNEYIFINTIASCVKAPNYLEESLKLMIETLVCYPQLFLMEFGYSGDPKRQMASKIRVLSHER